MDGPFGGYDVEAVTAELADLLHVLTAGVEVRSEIKSGILAARMRRLLTPYDYPMGLRKIIWAKDLGFDEVKTASLAISISLIQTEIAHHRLPAALELCRTAFEAWTAGQEQQVPEIGRTVKDKRR